MSQWFVACHAQMWTGEALLEQVQGGPAGRLLMMGELQVLTYAERGLGVVLLL